MIKLFSTSPKIEKSDKAGLGFLSKIMYFAPHKASGYNVCSAASPGCIEGCLHTSGFGGIYPTVPAGRIKRTKFFFENRPQFLIQLHKEVKNFEKLCARKNAMPALRLNGLSDLPWEKLCNIIQEFPNVQFYDYTKIRSRMVRFINKELPQNYHLTFSMSEINIEHCKEILSLGGNVAVVFRNKNLPKKFLGKKVFNGDHTDLRFLDPKKCVVGLYAKGRARYDVSGFVVNN